MPKTTKRIEIVSSANTRLSSMSQMSRNAILAVLSKHYTDVRITLINQLADLEDLVARRPDLVFLGMNYISTNHKLDPDDSEKIWVSGYLDEHAIAYTGSSQLAHEFENNKALAKQRVLDSDLKTSKYYVAHQLNKPAEADISLTYPLFVKPTNRGGGMGINSDSMVLNFQQLVTKIGSITDKYQADSLIEEYLPGREFSVAVLKRDYSDQYWVMPIELIAPLDKRGLRLLSEEIKSDDAESVFVVTDKTIKEKVSTLALNVFHALEARDYGRIDIRLNVHGEPQFLEANLIPSLISGYGSFPKACLLNIKLGYEQMILSIVRLALARSLDLIQPVEPEEGLTFPALEPVLEV